MTSISTALLTDKYELTMLSAAIRSGVAYRKATFEVFARKLPAGRRYGVVAGTQRALDAIKDFRFTPEQIEFLRADNSLTEETLEFLANFEFKGNVTAYAEGDLYFPYSPVLTVDGTFAEAVLLETVLLSIFNHDCAVAGAASRMVHAAQGKPVMELGARRTHEDAAVSASRAAYITGFFGTSNLEAAHRYGIPVFGTSAHAFTLAHASEVEAFQAQVDALGPGTTLLVDTYDTEQGIRNAVAVAGPALGAIRIDSGDLYEESVKARALLDSLGATTTKITVSSDLDEYVIDELMRGNAEPAPIDSFGAGTRVVTGSGHPTASMVYKLVAIEDDNGNMRPVAKASHGKVSIGGRKTSFRRLDENMLLAAEIIATTPEAIDRFHADGTVYSPQVPYVRNGEQVATHTLKNARDLHKVMLGVLPDKSIVAAGGPAVPTLTENGEAL